MVFYFKDVWKFYPRDIGTIMDNEGVIKKKSILDPG
jgi:hypothetical protein